MCEFVKCEWFSSRENCVINCHVSTTVYCQDSQSLNLLVLFFKRVVRCRTALKQQRNNPTSQVSFGKYKLLIYLHVIGILLFSCTWLTEWPTDWLTELLLVTTWCVMSDPVTEWSRDRMTWWPSDRVIEWPSDPVTQSTSFPELWLWPHNRVIDWLADPQTDLLSILISHAFILLAHGNLAAVVEVAPLRTLKPTPGYLLTGVMWLGFSWQGD